LIRKTLSSLTLTIVILIIIALISIVGTLFPQGIPPEELAGRFSPGVAHVLQTLQLTDVFHSFVFIFLIMLLALNLIVCSWVRLTGSRLLHGQTKGGLPPKSTGRSAHAVTMASDRSPEENVSACEAALQTGWKNIQRSQSGRKDIVFSGEKSAFSQYGVYVLHLSILIILAGIVVDSLLGTEGMIQLREGESANVMVLKNGKMKELDFDVRCDKVSVEFYPNGSPKTYRSDLTFLLSGRPNLRSKLLVNQPFAFGGYRFYQASYGRIPSGEVIIGYAKDGKDVRFVTAAKGTIYRLAGSTAKVEILRVEDDFMGMGPAAKIRIHSPERNTDLWLFKNIKLITGAQPDIVTVMPILNPKIFPPYEFSLGDVTARYYTGIQVMREPGVPLVAAGAMLFLLGMLSIYFFPHRRIWLRLAAKENGTEITITGRSRRDPTGLAKEIERIRNRLADALRR
ncbi:MAG: cytochrome c biogenesis protein ResB, partial [Smithellaceae bacterium]|nr:cytochrome c biogenesis protein ResB [Smithellaceae bacterium]